MELGARVVAALERHPAVRAVELTGSRAEGRATDVSDWDFVVDAEEFAPVFAALPQLVVPLEPLAALWDRLSPHWCYMLILRGPTKVDLIFPDEPHEVEPPWELSRETLRGIDEHFWDWTLWLNAKAAAGKHELVAAELAKQRDHLLEPLGVDRTPSSLAESVELYRGARDRAERDLDVVVPRELEREVLRVLTR